MDIFLLINIVGIIITLASISITVYTINQSRGEFRPVPISRQKAMSGTWTGKYEQIDPLQIGDKTEAKPSGKLTLELDAGKRTIKGEMTLEWLTGLDRTDKWLCKGGFKSERFLEITFQNRDEKIIQFGSLLMELDPLGKNLSGRVQGFGPVSGRIISGLVELSS